METRKFKRLPYGNSNFESVIMDGYAYVDKTHFIELLEQENNKFLFFTRPRKFGKSLFFTMLYHYYDICSADKFDTLFGDLYIGKHPTPKHNSYAVIEFDFSGLNTNSSEEFVLSFSRKIEKSVQSFLLQHKNLVTTDAMLIKQRQVFSANGTLGIQSLDAAYLLAEEANIKLFIIIDEYDHFANDLIAMGTGKGDDLYRKMIRANGSVRDFYETLKTGSKTIIDRILLTGVTPIMLDDLTSGFNIANSLSLKKQYNEMLGFTQEEVNWLMEVTGVDRSLIKEEDLMFHYNGYLFHKDGKHKVYNPSMMLYFFDMVMSNDEVVYCIDENLKTDYGRLRRLIMNEQNRVQLVEIAKNNHILSDIILKFSIDELHSSDRFVSLLFYMGLLTIEKSEYGRTWLTIPNYSIRTVYWEYIMKLTRDLNEDIFIDNSRHMNAMSELAYPGNPKLFLDYVSENIISRLSNRDLEHFDEKYLKIILLNNLSQSKLYIPISETEVSTGYTDIYLKRSQQFPDIPCEWVWELKYIKVGDAKKTVSAARKESRAQLQKYRDSHLFAGRTDVRYLSIIFIGKDKYEMEEL